MEDKTRGEVIPMPPQIAALFQKVTGVAGTWAAIKKLRRDVRTAETETTEYAKIKLDQLVQHISTGIRLSPPILDYSLKLSDVDKQGNVIVILLENDYTEDQLNADVDYLHYNITMTGAPRYIWHEGQKIAVDQREMHYRTIEPQSVMSFDPDNMSPVAAISTRNTKIKIERFGTTIEARDLFMPVQGLVERFGYEMDKAIKEGRTHTVESA